MKFNVKRKIMLVLCIVLCSSVNVRAIQYDETSIIGGYTSMNYTDVDGHWAYSSIESALVKNWINGYPDGSFRPNASITRAEFVKLLLSAAKMVPGSDVAEFYEQNTDYSSENSINDMGNHWLTIQGWTEIALNYGLIIPNDYYLGKFEGNKAITRGEMVVMTARILGQVHQAKQNEGVALSYTDSDYIPSWLSGYVFNIAEDGIVEGYPDGKFGSSQNATRAEALTITDKMMKYMESGIDSEISVYANKISEEYVEKYSSESPDVKMECTAQPLSIDGSIFIPARNVMGTMNAVFQDQADISVNYTWKTETQQLWCEYIIGFSFGAGYDDYSWRNYTFEYDLNNHYLNGNFNSVPRMLYGELMIPVYEPNSKFEYGMFNGSKLEKDTKNLMIYLPITSSLNS